MSNSPADWATVFNRVRSGVVRIDVSNCNESGVGTGFLIGPNLVATVAHVVQGMGNIRVTAPDTVLTTAATVIGLSPARDLALLRTATPIRGYRFALSATQPQTASSIAALGYSLGGALQISPGTVNLLHQYRHVTGGAASYNLGNVVVSDVAVNPGNSGGPWIAPNGTVMALDESGPPYSSAGQSAQGNNGGIAASDALPLMRRWEAGPRSLPPGPCYASPGTPAAFQETLDVFFTAIDRSDYDSAYAQHARTTATGRRQFDAGVGTTQDTAPAGEAGYFTVDDSGSNYLDATFMSHQSRQDAPQGTNWTCAIWRLRYYFETVDGLSLMGPTRYQPGTTGPSRC